MNGNQEPAGCLTAILRLFGFDLAKGAQVGEELPYRLRDGFLSPAERSFFGVLQQAVAGRAMLFSKVRVADLLYVAKGEGRQGHQNRIDRKHVDFVICAADTLRPLAAIELDDASHQREDRADRDDFLNRAFAAAGLPLLRFSAKRQYDPRAVAAELEGAIAGRKVPEPPAVAPPAGGGVPVCPKCGVAMVVRTATRGAQQGQPFYGCPNYPQCRATIPIPAG